MNTITVTRFFITRVELHEFSEVSDTGKLYKDLHKELEAKGFYKETYASDKSYYYLPDAVYESFTHKSSDKFNVSDVHQLARAAIDAIVSSVKKTFPKSAIYGSSFTVEVNGLDMAFRYLKKVPIDKNNSSPTYGKAQ